MSDDLDVESLRAATPGCAISSFFNHSGASLPSTATLSAITSHLEREALYGGMESAAAAMSQLDTTRRDAEALLGAEANEVAFTSSASAAIGLAFAALPPLKAGDRILVGRHEWGGNVSTYTAAAARVGARVEFGEVEGFGHVVVAARTQAFYALIHMGDCRENDHGRVDGACADLFQDRKSVHAGQVAVEDDEVEGARARHVKPVAPVAVALHRPAQLLEAVGDVVAGVGVVFNDEQSAGHENLTLRRSGRAVRLAQHQNAMRKTLSRQYTGGATAQDVGVHVDRSASVEPRIVKRSSEQRV